MARRVVIDENGKETGEVEYDTYEEMMQDFCENYSEVIEVRTEPVALKN
jgi:hypothetical protein